MDCKNRAQLLLLKDSNFFNLYKHMYIFIFALNNQATCIAKGLFAI